jgi:hypothetical protein
MKRVNQVWRGAFVCAAISSVWAVSPASAQVPGPQGQPGQPQQRQERPDNRSPSAIAAENYDPVGIPVGSFRLFPSLELDEIYNDNIYATSTNLGKTGSFIQGIKPVLDMRSDWNRHALNFFALGDFGIYSVDSINNYYDFVGHTDGRYDIQQDWNVYAGFGFSHLHEVRGTPQAGTVLVGTPPNQYNLLTGNLGYYQKFNRLSLRADGRVDNYNFTNQGPGPAVGDLPNFDRNRTEIREALRLGYDISSNVQVWTRGSLNQRTYQQTVDVFGFDHDSNGWDIVGGLALDLGGITFVEAFAGYVQQNYVNFPQVSAPTFGLTGYWNPIRELWVKPFVRRTVEESPLTTSSAYLYTSGGLDVDYKVKPNIRVTAHGDYAVADYNAITGTSNEYDQYLTLRIGFEYSPTRNFFVGPSYQYLNRWSNIVNNGFDQNLIMLRLGARL